jgi:ribosomal protein L32
MGKPKKRTSPRRTGMRRSHLFTTLARRVNAKSPVKVHENNRQAKSSKKEA